LQGSWARSFSEQEAAVLVADMDRQGFGSLSNFLSLEELQPIRAFAEAAQIDAGRAYVLFKGNDAFAGTALGELPASVDFTALCRRIYELGTGKKGPEVVFNQSFRCLQGETSRKHSYRFHYDSYVLTVLFPIVIPNEGSAGDLIVLPNVRRVRKLYFLNLIEKLLLENALTRSLLRLAVRSKLVSAVAVKMKPGNAYFFWGYRSIHTNEPCDPNSLRATALFHYADPHLESKAKSFVTSVKAFVRSGISKPQVPGMAKVAAPR
jgi:hypothetical protein